MIWFMSILPPSFAGLSSLPAGACVNLYAAEYRVNNKSRDGAVCSRLCFIAPIKCITFRAARHRSCDRNFFALRFFDPPLREISRIILGWNSLAEILSLRSRGGRFHVPAPFRLGLWKLIEVAYFISCGQDQLAGTGHCATFLCNTSLGWVGFR